MTHEQSNSNKKSAPGVAPRDGQETRNSKHSEYTTDKDKAQAWRQEHVRALRDEPQADREEMRCALNILIEDGQVVELRALDVKRGNYSRTVSGYFTDLDKLADEAMRIAPDAKGVYITLNPVDRDLLGRAANRLRDMGKGDTSTSDDQITSRLWLPFDVDPRRVTGVSSSEGEHEEAMERAHEIVAFLRKRGFPWPIVADSGNGAHVLFRIDFPVNPETDKLIERVINLIADRFSDDAQEVDRKVFNRARIWKLYGSVSRKGDHIAERPHRVAHLVNVPESLEVVTREQLETLVTELAPTPQEPESRPSTRDTYQSTSWNIDDWIAEHDLDVGEPQEYRGGRKWIFNTCPFNSDHTDRSAVLIVSATGALSFVCQHNSCHGLGWRDLRELVGDPKRDYRDPQTDPPARRPCSSERRAFARTPRSAIENLHTVHPPIKYAIPDFLPQGLTVMGGGFKIGKSWLCLDLALAVSQGKRAFGQIATDKAGVLYMALEDNDLRMQERMQKMLLGDEMTGDFAYVTGWERFDEQEHGLERLETYLTEHPGTRLVIVDTIGRVHPHSRSQNGPSYLEEVALFERLQDMAWGHEAAILLITHKSKGKGEDLLESIIGSVGQGATADTAMLLDGSIAQGNAVLHIRGRDVDLPGIALRWEENGTHWVMAKESVEYFELSEKQRAVINLFRSNGNHPLTVAEIVYHLGNTSRNAADLLVGKMTRKGVLVKLAQGSYRAAESYTFLASTRTDKTESKDKTERKDLGTPTRHEENLSHLSSSVHEDNTDARSRSPMNSASTVRSVQSVPASTPGESNPNEASHAQCYQSPAIQEYARQAPYDVESLSCHPSQDVQDDYPIRLPDGGLPDWLRVQGAERLSSGAQLPDWERAYALLPTCRNRAHLHAGRMCEETGLPVNYYPEPMPEGEMQFLLDEYGRVIGANYLPMELTSAHNIDAAICALALDKGLPIDPLNFQAYMRLYRLAEEAEEGLSEEQIEWEAFEEWKREQPGEVTTQFDKAVSEGTEAFQALPNSVQVALVYWIEHALVPDDENVTVVNKNSFERATKVYVSNTQFNGALFTQGFAPEITLRLGADRPCGYKVRQDTENSLSAFPLKPREVKVLQRLVKRITQEDGEEVLRQARS